MSSLALVNAGEILSGDINSPLIQGPDTIICNGDLISAIGSSSDLKREISSAERVIDACGATIAPGLIDSHCHVVVGDYTPRQRTVGFLESYTHGGITSVISAGEIHAPGRTHDAWAVKSLALAARACFSNFHPNGMKVYAGTVILEPGLTPDDFTELQHNGVRLAKFGFGNYENPRDGIPQVRNAQASGIKVMCHSGGASVPGSRPIDTEDLFILRPDIYGHINGGPTALSISGISKLLSETSGALQIVQAGNLRSSLEILKLAEESNQLERVVIGSDTPTGTGVMPLGVLKTLAELSSLGGVSPEIAWCLATGNNARIFGIPGGTVTVGSPADLVVIDAPWGSLESTALTALKAGDIPGISAVIIDGQPRVLRSRNTPAAARQVAVSPPLEIYGE